MFVLIAGGGLTASELARSLLAQGHQVHVVDWRREVLARLHHELPTEAVFEGSPNDPWVLGRAGITTAQVLAACLATDAENLALCFVARQRYQVSRTIACINDPRSAWLFDARFHVDVALNQAEILANLIGQEMSLGDMVTLLKLKRGRYSLVSEPVAAGARAVGVALKDLPLPPDCVIAAIMRRGELVIPRGKTDFEPGDEVLAIVDAEAASDLAQLFEATALPPRSEPE